MITFTFHSVSECKPEHGQDIIYLKHRGSFDFDAFEPRETTVEYCWFSVDENGDHDGNQVCYNPDEDDPEGCVLEILFDGYVAQLNDHWCAVDDYWSAIDKGLLKDIDSRFVRAYNPTPEAVELNRQRIAERMPK